MTAVSFERVCLPAGRYHAENVRNRRISEDRGSHFFFSFFIWIGSFSLCVIAFDGPPSDFIK
ncbi:MAG: hypothetical protein CW342_01480 [Thermoactinomycetaceae bacterium]|nr:hypothetical protein [Bacillota bacterium]MBO2531564.1 hypothetical protein [Thermoactinomycetaceae bacterium]